MISDNYFDLPEPKSLYCTVWSYTVSLGLLSIKVSSENLLSTWWLTFISVQYLELPTAWQSANFQLHHVDKNHSLFIVEELSISSSNCERAKIIAKKASVEMEIP